MSRPITWYYANVLCCTKLLQWTFTRCLHLFPPLHQYKRFLKASTSVNRHNFRSVPPFHRSLETIMFDRSIKMFGFVLSGREHLWRIFTRRRYKNMHLKIRKLLSFGNRFISSVACTLQRIVSLVPCVAVTAANTLALQIIVFFAKRYANIPITFHLICYSACPWRTWMPWPIFFIDPNIFRMLRLLQSIACDLYTPWT